MLKIRSMNVHPDTKEELLPEFHEDFPYIMTTPLFSYIEKNLTRGTGIMRWNYFIWKKDLSHIIRLLVNMFLQKVLAGWSILTFFI